MKNGLHLFFISVIQDFLLLKNVKVKKIFPRSFFCFWIDRNGSDDNNRLAGGGAAAHIGFFVCAVCGARGRNDHRTFPPDNRSEFLIQFLTQYRNHIMKCYDAYNKTLWDSFKHWILTKLTASFLLRIPPILLRILHDSLRFTTLTILNFYLKES